MSAQLPAYTDRNRADSFGAAAGSYDRFRPRYPEALITALIPRRPVRVLDVGAGTGIAAAQLRHAGADVIAVEPDARMAEIARHKGIEVEQGTFEDWDPAGRQFDLVVFAQSFHWVEPRGALHKVATIVPEGGRLALLSNRIVPTTPTPEELGQAYAGAVDASQQPPDNSMHHPSFEAMVTDCGFTVQWLKAKEQLHYSSEDWLNLVFTYSNILTMDAGAREQLRTRLETRIGDRGVDARNDAVAAICTPR